jgi:hypothetical protein
MANAKIDKSISVTAARLTFWAAALFLVLLAVFHLLKPEYDLVAHDQRVRDRQVWLGDASCVLFLGHRSRERDSSSLIESVLDTRTSNPRSASNR